MMIVYEGEYSWKGNAVRKERPISWWASSYHLKIVDLGRREDGVVYLKPVIVKIHDTGRGASVVNCLPELAKRICSEFELDLNRVLWVEEVSDENSPVHVASFEPIANVAGDVLYKTAWRTATDQETELIHTHL